MKGPFRSRKSGQVYYYDKKAGKYYDPLSDMYLQVKDVMENTASYDIDEYLSGERLMYFNPPQNNHNDFYHPLNQVNEEKQFKARIAFMGEPKDNARDMRAAGRMKMYDTATERCAIKRKSTVTF